MADWQPGTIPVDCDSKHKCKNNQCAFRNRDVSQHIWDASVAATEKLPDGQGFAFTCDFIGNVRVEVRKTGETPEGQCDPIW